jgi:hypothetical protein
MQLFASVLFPKILVRLLHGSNGHCIGPRIATFFERLIRGGRTNFQQSHV